MVALTLFPAERAAAQSAAQVQWTNSVNATAAGSALQKTGGCDGCVDAGAISQQTLNGTDGFAEFTPIAGARLYAGLGGDRSSNTDPALIDYAFSFWPDGGWDVRERSVYRADGRFVTGDVFRIAVVSGTVKYYQNGNLVYSSLILPPTSLVVDTTLVGSGATLSSAVITAASAPGTAPIAIATTTLPDGTLGTPYAAGLQASGGSGGYTWTITSGALPPSIALTAAGVLSGTPTAAGSSQFIVRATDAADPSNFADRALTILVPAPANAITIQTGSLPSTRLAQSYLETLRATGGSGTFRWTLASGSLPAGLALDTTSGSIQGTARESGRFPLIVRATDAADSTNAATASLSLSVLAEAPPSMYDAITDRNTRAKGALPALGPAGYVFSDPVFGTKMARITDRALRPGALERSYRTPSSTHANAWSADGRYFYTVSTDGTVIPFSFDATAMRAQRLQPSTTGDGGMTLRFFNEPSFSYRVPGLIYGTFNGTGANLRSIDEYDFETGQYSQIINLDTLAANPAGTYTGGLGVSAGPVERLFAFFGGTGQDKHFLLVVLDRNNPSNRHLLDTVASTIDGVPTNTTLNFKIHAANIDRSGRYMSIYPTGADLQAPRSAAPVYVWDIETGTFTALPLVAARTGGHDAFGYGDRVNQDCCTVSTWDAIQWQYRSLATPLTTYDLITPVLTPKEVYLADHPSWHNAQPDRLVPFLDGNYRYGANTTPWRALDEEIFAVQTEGAGGGATVWRFAHHRSAVADDIDPSRISFWYTPRVNISPDGHWALFTSNWEKTLGTDPRGETGGTYRQDVFLIELKRSDVVQPVAVVSSSVPSGTVSEAYTATLQASGGSGAYAWSVSAGALPAGLTLNSTGILSGTPTLAGTFTATIRVEDSTNASNAAERAFSIVIDPAALPAVVVTTTALANGTVSSAYSASLQATGGTGTYRWSISAGTLPSGLTLGATSGLVEGTPLTAGTATFTVRATDAAGSFDDQTLTITIDAQPTTAVVITTATMPDARRGVSYSKQLSTSGGATPFKWSLASGALPSGLTLNATTGTIAGVPSQVGTWTFTIRVTDAAVPTTQDTQVLSIRVRPR